MYLARILFWDTGSGNEWRGDGVVRDLCRGLLPQFVKERYRVDLPATPVSFMFVLYIVNKKKKSFSSTNRVGRTRSHIQYACYNDYYVGRSPPKQVFENHTRTISRRGDSNPFGKRTGHARPLGRRFYIFPNYYILNIYIYLI